MRNPDITHNYVFMIKQVCHDPRGLYTFLYESTIYRDFIKAYGGEFEISFYFTIVKAKPNRSFYTGTLQTWIREATHLISFYYDFRDFEGVAENDHEAASMHEELYKDGFAWYPEHD